MTIVCYQSDPVHRAGATYSVVAGDVGLRKFSSNKKFDSQKDFKKLDIIRRKVLRKFGWFLARLAYHRESLVSMRQSVIVWLHDGSCPRRSYLGLYLVHA